jgi:hypothetical protein
VPGLPEVAQADRPVAGHGQEREADGEVVHPRDREPVQRERAPPGDEAEPDLAEDLGAPVLDPVREAAVAVAVRLPDVQLGGLARPVRLLERLVLGRRDVAVLVGVPAE